MCWKTTPVAYKSGVCCFCVLLHMGNKHASGYDREAKARVYLGWTCISSIGYHWLYWVVVRQLLRGGRISHQQASLPLWDEEEPGNKMTQKQHLWHPCTLKITLTTCGRPWWRTCWRWPCGRTGTRRAAVRAPTATLTCLLTPVTCSLFLVSPPMSLLLLSLCILCLYIAPSHTLTLACELFAFLDVLHVS